MKKNCISLLLLMGSLAASAAEEMELSLYPYIRDISDEQREKWSPQDAIKALGNLPGSPTQATLDLLAETWKQPEEERLNHRHRQMEQLVKDGRTTDMNTFMLILSNRLWFEYLSYRDRDLYVNHMLKPYETEKPQELPHQQNWLGSLCFVSDFYAEYMLGITDAQRGIPARITENRYTLYKMRQQRAAEVNRLWSAPEENAALLTACGSPWARRMLRCLLHDSSVLYDRVTRSGLTCWHYTWGKDLPLPLELGLRIMQQRSRGTLPTEAELQQIHGAAGTLPPEMKAFSVRNLLAAAPDSTPWKKLNDPTATPEEMPDCTAVLLPQWSDEWLGEPTTVAQDIAELGQRVQEEADADRLSSLVLFTLAEDARILPDYAYTHDIPTQGHFRSSSTFDVEVSENGIDVLIDEQGPRFARDDEEMRRRCRDLKVALHRCALQLALLEKKGKTDDVRTHTAALADILNRHRLWPLLISQYCMRHLGAETMVELMHHCGADSRVLNCLGRRFTNSVSSAPHVWANPETKRRDESGNPDPEPELLAACLRDVFINRDLMPHSPEQLAEVQRRFLQRVEQHPDSLTVMELLRVGRMNDLLYLPEMPAEQISGNKSRYGYLLVRHALRKGDLPTAENILARMTADPKHYSYVGTRLAAALVARSKGDEATAREQERLGITLAAMNLNSRYVYYWEDAHRLLLEHGFTRESERLFLLLPNHEMRFMRPELVRSLAAQKRFRSAAFWLEFNLVDYLSTATPTNSMGTHADLVRWRLMADVYRALDLLQQHQTDAGMRLLLHALPMVEKMPELAEELAPAILQCADIPTADREEYRNRLLKLIPESRHAALSIADCPTVNENITFSAAEGVRTVRPFESPLYTWHLQKDTAEDAAPEDERRATRSTVQARIIRANYHRKDLPLRVVLETESGRQLSVPLEELEPDDLNNLIDWKKRNNIQTWKINEKKVNDRRPLEARPDRYIQESTNGSRLILDGVDVTDGRVVEFTTVNGEPKKIYANMLDEESRRRIEQELPLEQRQATLHTSLPAAEAEAYQRKDAIMVFMLGKRGGPEEKEFLRTLNDAEGKSWAAAYVLLVCYKDEQGQWERTGQQIMRIIEREAAIADPPGTPEHDRLLDAGFSITLDHKPRIIAHRFRGNITPEYKALTAAINNNNAAEVTRLLEAHPELLHSRTVDYSGCCPLQIAIRSGRKEIAELLLQRGASPETRNYSGMTLLHSAVQSRTPDMVRLLLQNGADPNRPSLEHHGAITYPLFIAQRRPQMLNILLEHGARVNQLDENGEHALFRLTAQAPDADFRQLEANARLLVPKGLPLNLRNKQGQSILFSLALCSSIDKYGKNPQRLANLLRAMKTLIELGADVHDTADGSPSLLSRLESRKIHPEAARLLREHGAGGDTPPPAADNPPNTGGVEMKVEPGEEDIRRINRATFTIEGPLNSSRTTPMTWDKLPKEIRDMGDRIPKGSRWIFRMPVTPPAPVITITVWKQ